LREIRSVTHDDEIRMVTMETTLPYSPTALPYLLSGKIDEETLWVVDEEFFRQMGAELVRGRRVVGIPWDRKEVVLDDGSRENFDTVLIATGSEPLLPDLAGFDTVSVLGFHTLDDYHRLVPLLGPSAEVILYGGGLVSMGLAANLAKRGVGVKVVVRSRILRRYFDPESSDLIAQVFTAHGVDIVTGSEVVEASPAGGRIELSLGDGRTVRGDVLVNCLGTIPRISFLDGSGISATAEGILVDRHMRTSRENVYAAGDVAVGRNFFSGETGTNAILPSAVEQGRVAGANMAGRVRESPGWISMNTFHFFGASACTVGLVNGSKDVDWVSTSTNTAYTKLGLKDRCLVGVQFVNVPVDPGIFQYLIRRRVDVGTRIEELLANPAETSRAIMIKKERG